jgi:NADH-quinone oxidoreductase subunit G
MSMEEGRIKITLDGELFEVKPERNLLHTCLALGFDVPHFCFHPALGSVGACRLCAVKKYRDESDTRGRIVMSCMEPVTEGLRISIEDEEVRAFRKAVIESLMINHPHDCPVCDEGGECHLQDMTVMTGHNYRRFSFRKRTFNNQNLGPFINHEMNRCIQCYRCVRFYKDYAGGSDFGVFGSRDHLYFGRFTDGKLENEFSGNLVEVCPTGVFTDKTLKHHYTRKWDMTNGPSICVGCSIGCNTIVSERYGLIRRIMNRYNGAVNGYFICDRGRYSYEFVNDERRIKHIYSRSSRNSSLEITSENELKDRLKVLVSANLKVIGIGSPRASLESNYSLSRLVGKENFYSGIIRKDQHLIDQALKILSEGGVHSPSLKEIEKADAVLILGEDLTNTAPMVALAVRQAARNKSFGIASKSGVPLWHDDAVRTMGDHVKSPVFIATIMEDKLDDIAERSYRASPQDIARLGFAVASFLHDKAPRVSNLGREEQELAEQMANELRNAVNPLIISGVHYGNEDIIGASANITMALSAAGGKAGLTFVFPECNSAGISMLGGKPIDDAMAKAQKGEVDTAIVLENDLYRRAASKVIDQFFENCKQVIVLDHLTNKTTSKADLLLPAGTFAESTGTLVNNEGRAQRYYKSLPAKFPVVDSWKWIQYLSDVVHNGEDSISDFDDVVQSIVDEMPVFNKIRDLTPEKNAVMLNEKIARQTRRFSGRTAIHARVNVSEQAPPADGDSLLAFTMEGGRERPPSSLVPFYWSPSWNSVQALYKYTVEPNGSMKGGNPGIRLIDGSGKKGTEYFSRIPSPFNPSQDDLLMVPVKHIYGSEELSSKCGAIAERDQGTTIYINQPDAERNKLKTDDKISFFIQEDQINARVEVNNSIPGGIAGLFLSISDVSYIGLPQWGRLSDNDIT